MRKLAALVAVASLVSIAGGCAKPAAITKAEYVATADGVCRAAKSQVATLFQTWVRDNPKDTGADGTERFVRFSLVKHYRDTMALLRTVPPVAGDAPYLDSMYRDFEHSLAILYSDPLGTSSLESEQAAEGRFRSYGMATCASMAASAETGLELKLKQAYTDEATRKPQGTGTTSASG